ncbi:MAG: hydantoinase/oxoprolinase family protein [Planctomycetota bacterium]|nr:hydantoinase/oxoprolinase family protein [Planctomycetota bacterium]
MTQADPPARRIGVDTGGTFTDLYLPTATGSRVVKLPSTPDDPSRAIGAGLADLCGPGPLGPTDHVIHGTTVGLNALLTRDVAPTALVTGRGFRDLIEIGRQERPDIYALDPARPAPVVPRELRFEVDERSWPAPAGGGGLERIARASDAELAELRATLAASGAEAIAVCLLHSWADPEPERRIAAALAGLGLPITTSSGIAPEYREFERFSTATVNAALVPKVGAYLERLAATLGSARLSLMQSSGGTIEPGRAAAEPARLLLSGPAGGVGGAALAAAEAGIQGGIVTFDMGGTSTDVAFHSGAREGDDPGDLGRLAVDPPPVGGLPVNLPSLDVHTIAAGGGSLARIDAGGVLHVGPASAGADPGPVAYGKSDQPTLTDAFVQLGRIQGGAFLGGTLELDRAGVARAFEVLGGRLGVSATVAAEACVEIGRAAMGRAIGAMTLQRGRDPKDLTLVAFGGAGGLAAVELARALGFPRVLIPADPGVLSARGLATAGFQASAARSLLRPLESCSTAELRGHLGLLEDQLRARADESGQAPGRLELSAELELRYLGQSYQLSLPWTGSADGLAPAFAAAHERFYGYRMDARSIELVHLRAHARVRTQVQVPERPAARELAPAAVLGQAEVWTAGSPTEAPMIQRAALVPGTRFAGPAVVLEYSGTTYLPAGCTAQVAPGGHLVVHVT